jgi:catechol 2,3-dioxygenase-like lactoylglutathione lyase family enzyme
VNLSYVTLFVSDLPACQRFYRDGLGLGVVHDSPNFVQLKTGGTTLALHATSDPERCSRGVNLHFDVPDVAQAMAELGARGVSFDGAPKDEPWGARVARAHDPAGNSVEIVQWLRA